MNLCFICCVVWCVSCHPYILLLLDHDAMLHRSHHSMGQTLTPIMETSRDSITSSTRESMTRSHDSMNMTSTSIRRAGSLNMTHLSTPGSHFNLTTTSTTSIPISSSISSSSHRIDPYDSSFRTRCMTPMSSTNITYDTCPTPFTLHSLITGEESDVELGTCLLHVENHIIGQDGDNVVIFAVQDIDEQQELCLKVGRDIGMQIDM